MRFSVGPILSNYGTSLVDVIHNRLRSRQGEDVKVPIRIAQEPMVDGIGGSVGARNLSGVIHAYKNSRRPSREIKVYRSRWNSGESRAGPPECISEHARNLARQLMAPGVVVAAPGTFRFVTVRRALRKKPCHVPANLSICQQFGPLSSRRTRTSSGAATSNVV